MEPPEIDIQSDTAFGDADLFAVFNRHCHVLPALPVFQPVKFPLLLVQLLEREAEQTSRVDEPGVELVFRRRQLLEESLREEAACRQVDSSLHEKRPWSGEPFVDQLVPGVDPVPDEAPMVDGWQADKAGLALNIVAASQHCPVQVAHWSPQSSLSEPYILQRTSQPLYINTGYSSLNFVFLCLCVCIDFCLFICHHYMTVNMWDLYKAVQMLQVFGEGEHTGGQANRSKVFQEVVAVLLRCLIPVLSRPLVWHQRKRCSALLLHLELQN